MGASMCASVSKCRSDFNKLIDAVDKDLVFKSLQKNPASGDTMFQRTMIVVVSVCVLMMSGCLVNHSNHRVVRQSEALQPFSFQSETARENFESQVEHAVERGANDSHSSFAIPFLVGLERSRKLSDAAVRNDVGNRLDTNGDGVISDYETSVR